MMPKNDIPRPQWEGVFHLLGIQLRCCVLEDGQRLINGEDMERLFEALGDPDRVFDKNALERFLQWFKGTPVETLATSGPPPDPSCIDPTD